MPLSHPALDAAADAADPIGTGAGDYPLLTLPEQRQIRHSSSTRGSLQVERTGSEKRVSLPKSIRHSYDGKTATPSPVPSQEPVAGPSVPPPEPVAHKPRVTGFRRRGQSVSHPTVGAGLVLNKGGPSRLDKGKGKAVMAPNEDDLERGPDVVATQRRSTASVPDGIGSAVSSSNSSIMGDPEAQQDAGEEWGPQHPCFPHLNPHVPIDSPEYTTTRIIRIRRDWLLEGDLAPTFSNLYPEILDPAGLSEQEFRRVVEKLNAELVPIFNPYTFRNMVDGVLGLVTGWLWEDFGLTGAKSRLAKLENWIEQWNSETEKTSSPDDGAIPPKLIPLRRTGYLTVSLPRRSYRRVDVLIPVTARHTNRRPRDCSRAQQPNRLPSRSACRGVRPGELTATDCRDCFHRFHFIHIRFDRTTPLLMGRPCHRSFEIPMPCPVPLPR